MPDGVEFDENQGFDPIPQPDLKPPTIGDNLIRSGVFSHPGDLTTMLGIFAVILIGAAFYLLINAVPPPPELGSDVLRSGESIPGSIGR